MKIGFIGGSGHFGACINDKHEIKYVGYCASDNSEDLTSLEARFRMYNLSPKKYETPKALLESGIDTVVINGIFSTNSEYIMQAMHKQIDIISEKPLATSLEQLAEIERLRDSKKGRLFTLFTQRYNDAFFTLKTIVDNGIIGEVRLINSQKSYKLGERADFYKSRETFGGLIPWVGIHMIDLILHICKTEVIDISAVQSRMHNCGNGELEMTALVNLFMQNEIMASVCMDYFRPDCVDAHGDDRLRIVGTKGIAEVVGGKVFVNEKEIVLKKSKSLLESFIDGDECEGIYSTKIALLAQQRADLKTTISC